MQVGIRVLRGKTENRLQLNKKSREVKPEIDHSQSKLQFWGPEGKKMRWKISKVNECKCMACRDRLGIRIQIPWNSSVSWLLLLQLHCLLDAWTRRAPTRDGLQEPAVFPSPGPRVRKTLQNESFYASLIQREGWISRSPIRKLQGAIRNTKSRTQGWRKLLVS